MLFLADCVLCAALAGLFTPCYRQPAMSWHRDNGFHIPVVQALLRGGGGGSEVYTCEDPLTVVERQHTEVVWTCLPFIRSSQNHLARHSERGKKTRQTEKEVGRHQ